MVTIVFLPLYARSKGRLLVKDAEKSVGMTIVED